MNYKIKMPVRVARSGLDASLRIIRDHLEICVIILASTITFFWLRGDELLMWTDFTWYLNAGEAFNQTLFLWDSFFQRLGMPDYRITPMAIPNFLFAAIAERLGIASIISLKVWVFVITAATGLSMYYLVISVFTDSKTKIAGMIAGLIYMFNPYTLVWLPATLVWYAFFPLKLGMFIKGIEKGKGGAYAFWICLVTLITTTSSYGGPQFLLTDIGAMLLYSVIFCVAKRGQPVIKRALLFTVCFAVSFLVLNLFWLLPAIIGARDIITESLTVYASVPDWASTPIQIINLNSASPFYDAVRLLGYWGLVGTVTLWDGMNVAYFPWFQQYSANLLVTLTTSLLPIFSFAMILKGKDHRVAYFIISAVIALILMSGTSGPFGLVNRTILSAVPLFGVMFKVPQFDFGRHVALSYSILIGLFVINFILPRKIFSLKRTIAASILLITVIGASAYPAWTGDIMNRTNSFGPHTYQIPSYYGDAKEWLEDKGSDFNVISLPYKAWGVGAYTWFNSTFYGSDPTIAYLGEIAGTNEFAKAVVTNFLNNPTAIGGALLSLINVRYVIVHNDTDWNRVQVLRSIFVYPQQESIEMNPVDEIEEILQQNGLSKVATFGKLIIYENMRWNPREVWASSEAMLLSDENSLFETYLGGSEIDRMIFLLENQNQEQNQLESIVQVTQANGTVANGTWRFVVPNGGFFLEMEQGGDKSFPETPNIVQLDSCDSTIYWLPLLANVSISTDRKEGTGALLVETSGTNGVEYDLPQSIDATGKLVEFWFKLKQPITSGVWRLLALDEDGAYVYLDFRPDGHWERYVFRWSDFLDGEGNFNVTKLKSIRFIWEGGDYTLLLIDDLCIDTEPDLSTTTFYKGRVLPSENVTLTYQRLWTITQNIQLSFIKISPVEYEAEITSDQPFWLILSQTFDKGWEVYFNGEKVPEDLHFTANGYCNAWKINSTGDLTIKLYFAPQQYVYYGATASIIGSMVYFLLLFMFPRLPKKVFRRG